jgi:hypothetical protein
VSPGRAGIGWQRTAAPGCLPAMGELLCLPRSELERAGKEDDHTDGDWYGARHSLLLHLDCRQRDTHQKCRHAERGIDEEVPDGNERGQQTDTLLANAASDLTVPRQHWNQRRQHHCHHHHDPHAKERRCGPGPRLSGHSHPRHRHRPAAGHRHFAHRRHRSAPDDRDRRAHCKHERTDAKESVPPYTTTHIRRPSRYRDVVTRPRTCLRMHLCIEAHVVHPILLSSTAEPNFDIDRFGRHGKRTQLSAK